MKIVFFTLWMLVIVNKQLTGLILLCKVFETSSQYSKCLLVLPYQWLVRNSQYKFHASLDFPYCTFMWNCLDVISNSEIVLPVLLTAFTTLHLEYVLGFLLCKYFQFIDFWHSSVLFCAFHPVISKILVLLFTQQRKLKILHMYGIHSTLNPVQCQVSNLI